MVQLPSMTRKRAVHNLEDLLAKSFEEETLEGLDCEHCTSVGATPRQTKTKRFHITAQPDLLCIQIARFGSFRGDHPIKRFDNVRIPEYLDLEPFCDSSLTSGKKYRLLAVVKHRGRNTQEGHYVAYTRFGDDWFLLNDDRVSKHSLIEAKSHDWRQKDGFQPYLVFYELEYNDKTSLPPTPTSPKTQQSLRGVNDPPWEQSSEELEVDRPETAPAGAEAVAKQRKRGQENSTAEQSRAEPKKGTKRRSASEESGSSKRSKKNDRKREAAGATAGDPQQPGGSPRAPRSNVRTRSQTASL